MTPMTEPYPTERKIGLFSSFAFLMHHHSKHTTQQDYPCVVEDMD